MLPSLISGAGKVASKAGKFAANLAKYGVPSGVISGGIGYFTSLLNNVPGDLARDMGDDQTSPSPTPPPRNSDSSSRIFSNLDLASIVNAIRVNPTIIMPDLGPDEGEYSQHLNLIIERVAKLESAVVTQNELIKKLEKVIDTYNEEGRREKLRNRRQEKEDDIEQRTLARNAGRWALDRASKLGSALSNILKPFLLPLAGLALASGGLGGEEDSEQLFFGEEGLGGKLLNAYDTAESFAVGSAFTGARLTNAFKDVGSMVKGAAGNTLTAGANAFKSTSAGSAAIEFVSRGKAAVTGATAPVINAVSNLTDAAKANAYIQNLTRAGSFLDGVAKNGRKYIDDIKNYVNSLPSSVGNIIRKTAKFLIKWFLIFETIQFLFRSAQNYALGTITAEQFHTGNKEQLNKLLAMFGMPAILMLIGSVAAPVGTIIGFVAGVFFSEQIYSIIMVDEIVNLLYDWWVLGVDPKEKATEMIDRIETYFMKEVPKYVKESVIEIGNNLKSAINESIENSDFGYVAENVGEVVDDTRLYVSDRIEDVANSRVGQGIGSAASKFMSLFEDEEVEPTPTEDVIPKTTNRPKPTDEEVTPEEEGIRSKDVIISELFSSEKSTEEKKIAMDKFVEEQGGLVVPTGEYDFDGDEIMGLADPEAQQEYLEMNRQYWSAKGDTERRKEELKRSYAGLEGHIDDHSAIEARTKVLALRDEFGVDIDQYETDRNTNFIKIDGKKYRTSLLRLYDELTDERVKQDIAEFEEGGGEQVIGEEEVASIESEEGGGEQVIGEEEVASIESEEIKVSVLTKDGFKDLTKEEIQQGKKDKTIKRSIANAALQEIKLLESENQSESSVRSVSEQELSVVPPPAPVEPPAPAPVVPVNDVKSSDTAIETAIKEEIKSGATAQEAIQNVSPSPITMSPDEFVRQQQEKFKADVASGKIKPTQNKSAEVKTERVTRKDPVSDFFAQQERDEKIGGLQADLRELSDERMGLEQDWINNSISKKLTVQDPEYSPPSNSKDPRYKGSEFESIDKKLEQIRKELRDAKSASEAAGDNEPDDFDRALEGAGSSFDAMEEESDSRWDRMDEESDSRWDRMEAESDARFDAALEGDDDFYDTPKPKSNKSKVTRNKTTTETVTGGGSITRYADVQVDTEESLALRAEADRMQKELDAKVANMSWEEMFDYLATDEGRAQERAINAKKIEAKHAMKSVPGGPNKVEQYSPEIEPVKDSVDVKPETKNTNIQQKTEPLIEEKALPPEMNDKVNELKKLFIDFNKMKTNLESFENSSERGTFKMIEDDFGISEDKVYNDPEEQNKYKELKLAEYDAQREFSKAKGDSFEKIRFLQNVNVLPQKINNMNLSGNRLDAMIEEFLRKRKIEPMAKGGLVKNEQTYLVGEEGPELLIPKEDGFVVPADDSKTMLADIKKIGDWIEKGKQYSNSPNDTSNVIPISKEKKDVVILPLAMQQRSSKKNTASYNAGSGPIAPTESASPTYSTKDNFLSLGYTT